MSSQETVTNTDANSNLNSQATLYDEAEAIRNLRQDLSISTEDYILQQDDEIRDLRAEIQRLEVLLNQNNDTDRFHQFDRCFEVQLTSTQQTGINSNILNTLFFLINVLYAKEYWPKFSTLFYQINKL